MDENIKNGMISIEDWAKLVNGESYLTIQTLLNGNSMYPLIRSRKDLVRIAPVRRNLLRGDIVLFRSGDGRYVVHRVVALTDDKVQTLGDWCFTRDSRVDRSCVIGLVTDVSRGTKKIHVDSALWRRMGRIWSALLPFRNLARRMIRPIKNTRG